MDSLLFFVGLGFKYGFGFQIWVWRFNSEFGIRNSELRGDERFNRYLASAFF